MCLIRALDLLLWFSILLKRNEKGVEEDHIVRQFIENRYKETDRGSNHG